MDTKVTKEKKTKEKKEKSPMVKKSIFIITCSCVAVGSAAIGGVGTYFIYGLFKPEMSYEVDFVDYKKLEQRLNSGKDFKVEFKDDQYNIINAALLKFGEKKQSLIMSNATVDNFSGSQHVKAITFYDNLSDSNKRQAFNQNVSFTDESAIIKINTAFRFYDNGDEKISSYEKNLPKDWKKDIKIDREYTYDEYIQEYGKLNRGIYVVNNDEHYLGDGLNIDGNIITGGCIYQISKKSVKNLTLKDLDNNQTEIKVELYSKYACTYYSRQIKKNGTLTKKPKFEETISASFIVDNNLNLISSTASENYTVNKGIDVTCNATFYNRFFSSDEQLVVENENIKIPAMGEQFAISMDEKGNINKDGGKIE